MLIIIIIIIINILYLKRYLHNPTKFEIKGVSKIPISQLFSYWENFENTT